MRVSVFGGSQPRSDSPIYEEAYQLGKLLAEKGHTVITGGYTGLMEAVSRGASEAGGHVIGVTCQDIEDWRPGCANAWVKEEQRKKTLFERLQFLSQECDAAIALPGGPGTLTEIALTWNLMFIKATTQKPLLLIGNGWRSTFGQIFIGFGEYMSEAQKKLVICVPDVCTAIKVLELESNS